MKYDPYCKNLKCRVFDIETTGLSSSRDRIISASFIDPDGSGLIQFFTEDPSCEDVIVAKILEELNACDCVITYNGNSFDIPFVFARAKKFGLDEELPRFRKIDIYRLLKHYWPLAEEMESLRQKNVEEVLGISTVRDDKIDGGECIQLYSEYLYLDRKEAKDLILLHNADDVRQLARITEKLSFLPYDRIAFEQGQYAVFETQTLFGSTKNKILVDPMKLTSDKLQATAKSYPPCSPAAYYNDSYSLQADSKGNIQIDINITEKDGMKFVDITNIPVYLDAFKTELRPNHGFLVLEDGNGTDYKACCLLALNILEKLR